MSNISIYRSSFIVHNLYSFMILVISCVYGTERLILSRSRLQCRHIISAPVDRMSASVWCYQHPWKTCQKLRPSLSLTNVACELKLRSVFRSWTYGCIHFQETGSQSAVRPCIMSGLPEHLVQEINFGTVYSHCIDYVNINCANHGFK